MFCTTPACTGETSDAEQCTKTLKYNRGLITEPIWIQAFPPFSPRWSIEFPLFLATSFSNYVSALRTVMDCGVDIKAQANR